MAKPSLTTWLKRALNDTEKGGKCTQFSMAHMVNGGSVKGKEVHTTKIGNGRAWSEAELAELLQDVANSYAAELQGEQIFQVMAFYEGNAQPQAFTHIKSQHQADDSENVTYAPNAMGRTAQAMSQESKVFAQVYNKQSQLDAVAMGLINFIGEDNINLRKENRELQSMFFEMMRAKVMNNQEHDIRVLQMQRDNDLRNAAIKLIPAAANSLANREIFPLPTEDTSIVEALADNIPIEQAQMLIGMLPPQLGGLIASRFERHAKAKRAQMEAANHAANLLSKKNPEDDAVGG